MFSRRLGLELRAQVVGDDAAFRTRPRGTAPSSARPIRSRPPARGRRGGCPPRRGSRPTSFGIDDLRPAGHLEHEVRQPRAERAEGHPGDGPDLGPLGRARSARRARSPPPCECHVSPGSEADEVPPLPLVHEQDRAPPARTGRSSPAARRRRSRRAGPRRTSVRGDHGPRRRTPVLAGGRPESLAEDLRPRPAERAEPSGRGLAARVRTAAAPPRPRLRTAARRARGSRGRTAPSSPVTSIRGWFIASL